MNWLKQPQADPDAPCAGLEAIIDCGGNDAGEQVFDGLCASSGAREGHEDGFAADPPHTADLVEVLQPRKIPPHLAGQVKINSVEAVGKLARRAFCDKLHLDRSRNCHSLAAMTVEGNDREAFRRTYAWLSRFSDTEIDDVLNCYKPLTLRAFCDWCTAISQCYCDLIEVQFSSDSEKSLITSFRLREKSYIVQIGLPVSGSNEKILVTTYEESDGHVWRYQKMLSFGLIHFQVLNQWARLGLSFN